MKQHIVELGHGIDYEWSQDHVTIKTPGELTDGRVAVVEDSLKPGFHLPAHLHRSIVEIFYVIEGEVSFVFDEESVIATRGTTVTIPADTRHEVTSQNGARLLTIFTPAGFDHYLVELAALSAAELADADRLLALGERYDIWPG